MGPTSTVPQVAVGEVQPRPICPASEAIEQRDIAALSDRFQPRDPQGEFVAQVVAEFPQLVGLAALPVGAPLGVVGGFGQAVRVGPVSVQSERQAVLDAR